LAVNQVDVERVKAVERKKMNRRIKQYFMLVFVSLPLLIYLGFLFEKINLQQIWSILIYSGILIVLWCFVLLIDKLVLKRAKKLRQIKNAKAVLDKYNAEVERKNAEIKAEAERLEQIKAEKERKKIEKEQKQIELEKQQIELPNSEKNDTISNIEKKNKIKQKKYGNFNNKRKK